MSPAIADTDALYEAESALEEPLLNAARRCLRPPVGRFHHPFVAAMPLAPGDRDRADDRFTAGDYSAGLFHHDASESAVELLRHDELRRAAAGGLLDLLDTAEPSGRVHRIELPHKAREREPAKPVIAQYALRATDAMGLDWCLRHRVYARARQFVDLYDRDYAGLHGLALTPSSRGTGFDNDPLSAGFPDASVEAPDTNTFLVLEHEALATLAERLERREEAEQHRCRAAALRALIEELLYVEDDRGGFYRALRWRHGVARLEDEAVSMPAVDGRPVPIESWISLLPLYAGIPSAERAERVMQRLLDPELYWGPSGVRTVPASSPLFHQAARVMLYDHKRGHPSPVSNWCGPIWVLSSYYLAVGLRRYGRADRARELALTTARLLRADLDATGGFHECYDDHGRGMWPPHGSFSSWNVLALTMLRDAAAD